MKDSRLKHCYWVDIQALASTLLKKEQQLVQVKYFTAIIAAPEPKRRRQEAFLEANRERGLQIILGKYLENATRCCGRMLPKEKQTDVNISVEMLVDAFENVFDTLILVSADSDLTPPIMKIRALFPTKRIIVAHPPGRWSNELKLAAHVMFPIWEKALRKSQ